MMGYARSRGCGLTHPTVLWLLNVMGKIAFRFFGCRSGKVRQRENWMFAPSLVVWERKFFVSVNRFWCVWIRVLVLRAA
jgi:hypothetical protein